MPNTQPQQAGNLTSWTHRQQKEIILEHESSRFIGQHLNEARIMVRYPQGMSEYAFERWAWKLASAAAASLPQVNQ